MNKELDYRFTKVKKLPLQANSTRNLYLRKEFAKKMLDLLSDEKRILNVDETWVAATNYRRRVWHPKNQLSSQKINPVAPRITMIAAVDNYGEVYLSLMQSNCNQDTFCLYLMNLVA